MRHPLLALAVLCGLCAPLSLHTPAAMAATTTAAAVSGVPMARVIVKYKAGRALAPAAVSSGASAATGRRVPQHASTLARRMGRTLTDGRAIGDDAQVVLASGISSKELAAQLAADPDVEYAEVDVRRQRHAVPNDPLLRNLANAFNSTGQWFLRAPDPTFVSAINAPAGWPVSRGTSGIVVAVIDSGVRFDHPDLVGKLYPGYDFVAKSVDSNDGSGLDGDASDPGDWITAADTNKPEFADCPVQDSSWHGTRIAGLIGAATNNGLGIAGAAPNVMVLPVRVLGKCGGFDSDIVAGLLWAGGVTSTPIANPHPAKVINLSLGSTGACTSSYRDAFNRLAAAGVTVVISGGNEGTVTDTPANCSDFNANVIAVGGLEYDGSRASYANFGREITISAPSGRCDFLPCGDFAILSTANDGTTGPGNNTYGGEAGTSFSAPLVAATAALMLSVDPTLTPAQIKSKLQSSARTFPATGFACTTTTCGAGMLDVGRALAAVAPALAPQVSISASTANPAVDDLISIDSTGTTVAAGGAGTYQWAITGGSAEIVGAADQPQVVVKARGDGFVSVRLTVTDSVNMKTTSATTTMLVGAPVSANPDGGSDGGGGALGLPWLAGLGLAVWALRRTRATA